MTYTDTDILDLAACIDCIMATANGTDSLDSPDAAITYGMAVGRWHRDGYRLVNGGDSEWFAWSPCEVCESPLGGTRGEMHAITLD